MHAGPAFTSDTGVDTEFSKRHCCKSDGNLHILNSTHSADVSNRLATRRFKHLHPAEPGCSLHGSSGTVQLAARSAVFSVNNVQLAAWSAVFSVNSVQLADRSAVFSVNSVQLAARSAVFSVNSVQLADRSAVFSVNSVQLAAWSAVFSVNVYRSPLGLQCSQ